ncbi:MAG: response regulator [bacterium]|nr:response regulator [bacterium]
MPTRVLLIEDDPAYQEYVSLFLDPKDFEITCAESLTPAFARLRAERFDVILLDLSLPDADGMETFLKLAARKTNVPVVIFTGARSDVIEERTLQMGAQDFVVKSDIDARGLTRVLNNAIQRQAFLQSLVSSYEQSGADDRERFRKDRRSILIIEDDEDQGQLLLVLLKKAGYEARVNLSGTEAVQTLNEWQPDVVLVDLNLPGMNGIETTQLIRSHKQLASVPVIMMSADSDENTVVRALSHGVDEFIGKPVRTGELTVRISNLLDIKEKERRLSVLSEKLEREKSILARYFSDDFVEGVLSERISPKLGGQNLEATLMFFDLRNSTGIAEYMPAGEFSTFLSNLFSDLYDLVMASGGSVNKFTGDGLLATFGCPISGGDDAFNAIKCAFKFRDFFAMFNEYPPVELKDPLGYGIGIASGPIFAGNVGSFRRMEYSVLGDPVNLASRLEGLTKKAKVDIFVDGQTREHVGDRVKFKRVRHSKIRGKSEAVKIFYPTELIGE